jgi:hypothetical protein
MKRKVIGRHIALMVTFAAVGLVMFTEGVRTVQVLGLFASGAVFGALLGGIIQVLRKSRIEP